MKAFATALVALLLAFTVQSLQSMEAVTSIQKTGVGGDLPVLSGTGGPDDYGYTWIDSHEPGGPTYNWRDITGVGTQVIGLGDDNSVGPFPIGFDFPYYWYMVDQFYVGSNGWISFSSGQNFAHPFAQLPNPNLPNDLLACLAGDIDFSKGGTCYYYTTPGLDSLIVSYLEVPEFRNVPPTSHTFQIILNRADSTITYQYGEQIGRFTNGQSYRYSMGWENSTGTIGLSYAYNTGIPPDPPQFADSTVILFIPPDSTTFVAHDIGMLNAMAEGGKGIFMITDSSVSVWSDVRNFGNQVEGAYGASVIIEDASQTTVYTDSITVLGGNLQPSEVENFTFEDPFVPTMDGLFTATFGAHLPPGVDIVPQNDEMVVEMYALTYPTVLLYDDNVEDESFYWSGDSSGYGNEFEPPLYPTYIENAQILFDVQVPGQATVVIYDDDGPSGAPGTLLASETIFVSGPGWRTVDFSDAGVAIEDGNFFAGAVADSGIGFYTDTTAPLSKRGWEFTGGWAPSRNINERDIMIRVSVSDEPFVGVGDGGAEVSLPTSFALTQNYPNPFNPSTTIAFDVPIVSGSKQQVSLAIYDIRGRRVKTLINAEMEPGQHKVTWNGKNDQGEKVSSGIYLYTLKAADQTFTRKMVILK